MSPRSCLFCQTEQIEMQDDKNVVLTTVFANCHSAVLPCGLFHLLISLFSFSMWKRPQFFSGFLYFCGFFFRRRDCYFISIPISPCRSSKSNFLWSFPHCFNPKIKIFIHSETAWSSEPSQQNSAIFSLIIMRKRPQFFRSKCFGLHPSQRRPFQVVSRILSKCQLIV